MIRLYLLLALGLAQAAFAERLIIRLSTGGGGLVSLPTFIFPPVVFLAVVVPCWRELRRLMHTRIFMLCWMPYLAFTFALPILAVPFMDYPVRTVFSSYTALGAMAFVALGAAGKLYADGMGRTIGRVFLAAVLAQLALALLQVQGEFSHLPGFLQRVYDWDFQYKVVFETRNLITARATGFYQNPNALGIWSLLAMCISFFLLEGRQRIVGSVGALATLLLCQSRGSLFAFIVSGGIYSIVWLVLNANRTQRRIGTLMAAFVAPMVAFVFIPGVADSALVHLRSVPFLAGGIDRYASGTKVLYEGASADMNFLGRVQLWKAGFRFLATHPFGSFGSPEVATGVPVDNQLMYALEQGSWYFLLAVLLAFLGAIRLIGRPQREARALAFAGIALFVNGMSAVPLYYFAAGLFWLLVGIYLAREVQDRSRQFREAPPR